MLESDSRHDLWYEKYRPKTFDGYTWTNDDTKMLVRSWINDPSQFPHLILNGPSGTGKTTLALVLKSELGVDDADFMFFNSSKDNSVNVIRESIYAFCTTGGWSRYKIIILDEAERYTVDAQKALRGVIDEFSASVRFILTCNDLRKIHSPLTGRCIVLNIDALDQTQFAERIMDICASEKIDCESETNLDILATLVDRYYPNMRKAINYLQQIAVLDGDHRVLNPAVFKTAEPQGAKEWENNLFSVLAERSVMHIREFAAGIPREEIEQVYQSLYEQSSKFGKNEGEAILIIAKHLVDHPSVAFPEINLCAALLKLHSL